ncbi:calcium-translocating P-type ATPase, PMCA-type [Bacillus sp. SM2101]|uniref:calcium-translocating P-type ATPase, PMCA-type n=1 Tax=Bacillus sp. SM2101 TaxID=2805366 RepID=UPI001BDE5FF8|nr:calcium-translocating P-type ATPase, PMCA-type [Bacillus sp. SM2101]
MVCVWYAKEVNDIATELDTNLDSGLSSIEAKQRLERNGPNEFKEQQESTLLQLLWGQINSALIYILLAAAIVSFIVGEISDAIVIFIVIGINAVIGIIQESKAEKALEELKKMSTPKAIVKRDGIIQEIPSKNIVIGDIVVIDTGRYIPADVRFFETVNLKVEESALTGESLPVEKNSACLSTNNIPLSIQQNMGFMSTLSTYGRGLGIVIGTGMDTEIGKIASLLREQKKSLTPLQKKLDELGKLLGFAAIIISMLVFLIGFFQERNVTEIFLIAVSLAVAAIPEGLPAIVTIVLALGVQRLIKKNAIVRKLPAVETLGSVSVICSDKTGTLTQNKMTVTKTFINGKYIDWSDLNVQSKSSNMLIKVMLLCNDASLYEKEQIGDPTEVALLAAGINFKYSKADFDHRFKRLYEIPFDSDRKLMTTVHHVNEDVLMLTKGALESILPKSTNILIDDQICTMSNDNRDDILEQAKEMANASLRVLAFAYKMITNEKKYDEIQEDQFIFIGLVGMIDPPRLDVKESIELCKKAGVKLVMITGDNHKTALAISKQLGIAEHEYETMTGQELDKLTALQLKSRILDTKVFARVSPEHKVRIVDALRSNGNIVAMTGDGVNDAPSLKKADVGVAMGITGTDVAKGASDIILTDDRFSTIVSAVKEGRNIYLNIKKSILYLLSCNLGEIVALVFGILMGWPAPLTAIHILWVNLITDTLPAIALGFEKGNADVMNHKPRDPKQRIITNKEIRYTLLNGLVIGIATLIAFSIGLNGEVSFLTEQSQSSAESIIRAQTMAFLTLSFAQLFHSFNLKHEKETIFQKGFFLNKYLIGAFIIGFGIQVLLVNIPFFHPFINLTYLSLEQWSIVIVISIIPIIVNEISKLLKNKYL